MPPLGLAHSYSKLVRSFQHFGCTLLGMVWLENVWMLPRISWRHYLPFWSRLLRYPQEVREGSFKTSETFHFRLVFTLKNRSTIISESSRDFEVNNRVLLLESNYVMLYSEHQNGFKIIFHSVVILNCQKFVYFIENFLFEFKNNCVATGTLRGQSL